MLALNYGVKYGLVRHSYRSYSHRSYSYRSYPGLPSSDEKLLITLAAMAPLTAHGRPPSLSSHVLIRRLGRVSLGALLTSRVREPMGRRPVS